MATTNQGHYIVCERPKERFANFTVKGHVLGPAGHMGHCALTAFPSPLLFFLLRLHFFLLFLFFPSHLQTIKPRSCRLSKTRPQTGFGPEAVVY